MKLSLTQKSIFLTVLMVSITAVTIGIYAYRSGTKLLVSHALVDLSDQVGREELIFVNHLKNLTADVHFIAGTPPIRGIYRAQATGRDPLDNSTLSEWKKRLNVIFSTLLQTKQEYLQIRLLDRSGKEVVRTDRVGDHIISVKQANLQNKSSTPYVQATLGLAEGATYLSAINLNREHGKISIPYTPMLRAATPVYDHGKLLGMVVINLDVGKILNNIATVFSKNHQSIFITNEHGSYLIHPDPKKRFGFDLGHRYRIQEDYPRLASLFMPDNTDSKRTIIPKNKNDLAIVSRKIYFGTSPTRKRFILIALTRPYAEIVATESATLLQNGQLIFLLMAIFIVIGYLVARHLSKPMNLMTQTITAFGSNHNYSPPTSILTRRDEIGVLARAFHQLVDTITSTQTQLQVLNTNLENEIEKRTAELHDSEQRWQFALEGAQQGVWDWNLRNNDVFFSRQWKAMLGFADDEISNSVDEWTRRIHPEDLPQVQADLDRHFSGHTTLYKNEHRMQCKDSSYIWVLDQGMVVERDQENQPVRMIGTYVDISERKLIDKMKNEFISTVSHELRTPLTSIRGSLGLVTGGAAGELSERAAGLLSIAHRNTERLLLLINDILDLQKIESGNMPFDFKPMSLRDFIAEAIEANKPFAQEQHVNIQLNDQLSADVQILADQARLIQVMNNLLSNAAKFSPRDSTIDIDLSTQQHQVTIAVRDHGPGIPDEFRDKLFDKFTQSDASDSRHVGGTGLGLSISKLIAEKHNGTITYESTPGKGTTFFLHLSALDIHPTLSQNQPEQANRDILIIEDDADVASLLAMQLSNAGYWSEIASNAEQAWELLQTQHFDAITLDIALPGQDGISFLKQLRQQQEFRDLPVLIISAYVDSAHKELSGSAIGIVDWITKPFDPAVLKRALHNTIDATAPRILYVEDDPDLQRIVSEVVDQTAKLRIATSLKEARQYLAEQAFDLVLLDIGLPDGNGLELLADLEHSTIKPQVVIYSADPIDATQAERVSAVLLKSNTTNSNLILTLKQYLSARSSHARSTPQSSNSG